MAHAYAWKDVRDSAPNDLRVGDVFVNPGTGTGYYVAGDGAVRGAGWQPLDGVAWTVTAREGDALTCRADDGREITEVIPLTARVLRVVA